MFKRYFTQFLCSDEYLYLLGISELSEPTRTERLVDLFEKYFKSCDFKNATKVAMKFPEPKRSNLLGKILDEQIKKKHFFGKRKTIRLILKLAKLR